MTQKSETGKLGEDLACNFLIGKRFKIICRNYRKPWGEIDIIAKDPDGTLVFVEVKCVRCNSANTVLQPEDNLTGAKLKKLQRTAELFVGSNEKLVDESRGWRIDLVAITLSGNDCRIQHYENIS